MYGRRRTMLKAGSTHERTQKRLPMGQWKIRINDKYLADIEWATFDVSGYAPRQLQRIRPEQDPRGTSAGQGVAPWDRPLRRMRAPVGRPVQAEDPLYLQLPPSAVPGPRLPVPPGRPDRRLRGAVVLPRPCRRPSWTSTTRPRPRSGAEAEAVDRARREQIERLRYQARLAERQFTRTDPENRLVAAELERRWEASAAGTRAGRGLLSTRRSRIEARRRYRRS